MSNPTWRWKILPFMGFSQDMTRLHIQQTIKDYTPGTPGRDALSYIPERFHDGLREGLQGTRERSRAFENVSPKFLEFLYYAILYAQGDQTMVHKAIETAFDERLELRSSDILLDAEHTLRAAAIVMRNPAEERLARIEYNFGRDCAQGELEHVLDDIVRKTNKKYTPQHFVTLLNEGLSKFPQNRRLASGNVAQQDGSTGEKNDVEVDAEDLRNEDVDTKHNVYKRPGMIIPRFQPKFRNASAVTPSRSAKAADPLIEQNDQLAVEDQQIQPGTHPTSPSFQSGPQLDVDEEVKAEAADSSGKRVPDDLAAFARTSIVGIASTAAVDDLSAVNLTRSAATTSHKNATKDPSSARSPDTSPSDQDLGDQRQTLEQPITSLLQAFDGTVTKILPPYSMSKNVKNSMVEADIGPAFKMPPGEFDRAGRYQHEDVNLPSAGKPGSPVPSEASPDVPTTPSAPAVGLSVANSAASTSSEGSNGAENKAKPAKPSLDSIRKMPMQNVHPVTAPEPTNDKVVPSSLDADAQRRPKIDAPNTAEDAATVIDQEAQSTFQTQSKKRRLRLEKSMNSNGDASHASSFPSSKKARSDQED